MHGPSDKHGASRRGPSDYAAASLRDHLARGGDADAAGNVAAADEIERGCFAPFVPTPPEQVSRLVELGSILGSDMVCDLGFGDAALLCGIVQLADCKGCGCEINSGLVASARALADSSGSDVTFTESGIARYLLSADFEAATVIVCFLVPEQLKALLPAFNSALTAGVRIITQRYQIPGLDHLRCLDSGARLEGAAARSDAFGWISQEIEELKDTQTSTSYFPDQGPAFLYSLGP
jgi:hypothetical protein